MKTLTLKSKFTRSLLIEGKSKVTAGDYSRHIDVFLDYMEKNGLEEMTDVTKNTLKGFQTYLFTKHKSRAGKKLKLNSQHNILCSIKSFFCFLIQNDHIMVDPASSITLPKIKKSLPKDILTEKEMKRLLETPDTNKARGYQERVVIELLYGTGIRNSEARFIKLVEVDLDDRVIFISNGKGGKDRVVPINKILRKYLKKFINDKRPLLIGSVDTEYLLVGVADKAWGKDRILKLVQKYVKKANIRKHITTHSLRHTCASHLQKNNAPIRVIQEILGHVSLNTTQIYTHVDASQLKDVIDKFHPRRDVEGE